MKTGRPVKFLYTREEVFYAHRGRHPMQHALPKVGADARTARSPRSTSRILIDGGAYSLVRPGHRRTTRASSSPARTASPSLPLRLDALLHQQAPLRPQARPRQRAAALRLRGLARQDRRAARHRPDRAAPEEPRRRADARTVNGHARHLERLPRSASTRSSRRPAGRSGAASSAYGRGLGVAGSDVHQRHRLLHLPERDAAERGCSSSSTAPGVVTVFSGATDIGQGSNSLLAVPGRRGARPATSRDVRVVVSATPI